MAKKRGNNEGSIVRRKDGLWMAQMTVGRNPETGKIRRSTFYGKTRKEVADKLAKALRDQQQGIFVEPHKLTLGEWLDKWLWDDKRARIRAGTFDSYEQHVRRHIKPALGAIPMRDLRPKHLQRFYNEKTREGLSARTVRYCHTLLYSSLSQAEKNQLIAKNIAALVEPPRKQRKEMPTLSQDQVANRLLPAIAKDRLAAAIFMSFGTGLRRDEILGLRWQDVDLQEAVLHVKQALTRVRIHDAAKGEAKTSLVFQEPKTEQSRRAIPIPAACLIALRKHKAEQAQEKLLQGQAYQDHGLVFCRPDGRPIDPSDLSRHFGRLLKREGLPSIRLHDARHTFATLLLELGEAPKVVQSLLGHSSVAITLDVYSHVSLELERKAVSKLDAVLTGGK